MPRVRRAARRKSKSVAILVRKKKVLTKRQSAAVLSILLIVAGVLAVAYAQFFLQSEELAASVNGIPITMVELDEAYSRIPILFRQTVTKESVLNQIIARTLIQIDAEKSGLVVEDEQVDRWLENFVASSGLTEEQMQQRLEQVGLTEEALRASVRKELFLETHINNTVLPSITVTNEEVLETLNSEFRAVEIDRPFEEVEAIIRASLFQQKYSIATEKFVSGLRENAEIIIYFEEPAVTEDTPSAEL